MDKSFETTISKPSDNASVNDQTVSIKSKSRGRKRKRRDSESSSDFENILPDNALEVEKNLHASAIKNNLDDVSVKKILKKVVTNDHVLALVKLREEEEHSTSKEKNPRPKLTRAKAKELKKVSPQSAEWNLDLVELTPIKHIPVKTRPEVEALITKELPDDEDDEEYEPTHDDVPSDDDQTLESCSDFDSLPSTPATPPARVRTPRVATDGPFKVPPAKGLSTPARRKLLINDEEEATIALRTRSKINLSATSIEHIESSFVPPDDVPRPIRDDLWDRFLEECLNPAEASRHEDDDEADPEYNVAADADAHDEDEEAALDGIIKISRKELNDLVTELFSVMPGDDELAETLAHDVLNPATTNELSHWEGKQEPISEDENQNQSEQTKTESERTSLFRRDSSIRFSIGKSEPEDIDQIESDLNGKEENVNISSGVSGAVGKKVVRMSVEEQSVSVQPAEGERAAPPPLLRALGRERERGRSRCVTVHTSGQILPEQIQVLQQQIRQHVQLAASNFLQLYVNPAHWNMAPAYKEYLEHFDKMVSSNWKSVANVCNLRPALELVRSWEKTVAENTPENKEMVEFIQKEAERSRRRFHQNSLYVGDFPEMFMQVVANSTVFLYPYLLPAMPYRADANRKFGYRRSEDELIALGLDQFWQYIEDNPELFRRPKSIPAHTRWGYALASALVCKHMFPWLTPKLLRCHVWRAKRCKDNPIQKFFATREVTPVTHKLLAYNPKLTLYEQPEHEMPRIWIRYLAKNSQRFRSVYYTRRQTGVQPEGVTVTAQVEQPKKNPLPADFTKSITKNRSYKDPERMDNSNVGNVHNTTVIISGIPPQPVGPVLTINPLSSTHITNIISSGNENAIAPKGKVPISANKNNCNEVMKSESLSNPQLMGKLIPVCVSKLIDPNTQPVASISFGQQSAVNLPGEQASQGDNNFTLLQNMFRVIQTTVGAYLVPLTVVQNTNTVNSITSPIVSTKDTSIVRNDLPEPSRKTVIDVVVNTTEELKNHCKCCMLLRKICKERQTRITDFFKPKRIGEKKCDCSHRVFPRVSKRLKLLVDNYKSKPLCARRRIEALLESARNRDTQKGEEYSSRSDYDLEDIAYVSTYQIKLIQKAALAKNVYLKKRIGNLFSKFDPDTGDPVHLSERIMDFFGVDLIDMYKEFLAFLTPEQADKISRFKDYFVHSCMRDLVNKVEEEIEDSDERNSILTHLNGIFGDNLSTSCELCFGILSKLRESPRLAKYVFSLFPHRVTKKERDRCQKQNKATKSPAPTAEIQSSEVPGQQNNQEAPTSNWAQTINETEESSDELIDVDEPADGLTICDATSYVVEYEAEEPSSEENTNHSDTETTGADFTTQHSDDIKNEEAQPGTEEDITIGKTEFHDHSDSTVMSPLVMSEDEPVKSENPEWKRDEDKQILEILLQCLTPQERKEKTIFEILDEKNVYQMIAEGLPHKPMEDVKDRVMYLLEILVLSEY